MWTSADFTAVAVFATLCGVVITWVLVAWRRSGYTPAQFFLYLLNKFFTRVLWRTEVSGPLPIADDQGAVIVSNHKSGIDPLLIQLCTKRVVHWMVAREYFGMPLMAFTFKNLGSIPVNRGGVDTAATKTAIRLVQNRGLVGVFPEGRVNLTDELLLPGRPGAALIALKARVNVIPCYVIDAPYDGTPLGSFFMAAKAQVVVGPLIDISQYFGREGDKTVLEELTKRLLVEIAKLAGATDFQPKLAGRHWKPGQGTSEGATIGDEIEKTIVAAPDQ